MQIEKGPMCFMKKGWKIVGSFFAFDNELYGSTQVRLPPPYIRTTHSRSETWDVNLCVCMRCTLYSISPH